MKTWLTLKNEKGVILHHTEIAGGFDLGSTVRMAIGRAKFEMDKEADTNWTKAYIEVQRWDV
jgi:hypothetical protein